MIHIFLNFRNQLTSFSDYISDLIVSLPNWFCLFLSCILILIFILPGQFSLPPLDRDEARFSQASKQMVEDKNYVTIKFQDKLRAKKPIGIYWIQSFSANLFGKDKISSYRIPNILGAFLICVISGIFVYNILYQTIGQSYSISLSIGIISSIIFVSLFGFAVEIRQAKTDTFLLLFCLCQQWMLWKIYSYGNSNWNEFKINGIPWTVRLFWLFMALGILIKGPIAPLLAVLTIISLVFLDKISLKSWNLSWLSLFLWVQGIFIISIINLPWVILAWKATNGQLIINAINNDLLQKIISGQENHWAPPGTHFIYLLLNFWPLSLFIPLAGRAAIDWKHQKIIRFLLSWIIPFWIIMEIIPTKLPHYILPIFPALITLIMIGFSSTPSGNYLLGILRQTYKIFVVIVTVLMISLVAYMTIKFSSNIFHILWVFLLGVFALLSICMGYIFLTNNSRYKLAPLFFMVFFAGISNIILIGVITPKLDKIHISSKIHSEVLKINPYPEIIVSSGYVEPSLVFLLGKDIFLVNPQEAAVMLVENPKSLAIIEKRSFNKFHKTILNLDKKIEEISFVKGYNLAKGESVSVGLYQLEKNLNE